MTGKSEQEELEATGHNHILTQKAESSESDLELSSLSPFSILSGGSCHPQSGCNQPINQSNLPHGCSQKIVIQGMPVCHVDS